MVGRGEKWAYEIILENVPPFKWLPSRFRVLSQLLLMEILGMTIALLYGLPVRSIIFGSLAILAVIASSMLAVRIAPRIRSLRTPSASLERDVLDNYRVRIFSRNHHDVLLGLMIFTLVTLYLLTFGNSNLSYWLGQEFPSSILLFVLLLLWDVSYRIGLGIWMSFLALYRSTQFLGASRRRLASGYTPYRELATLKRLDLNNVFFGLWPLSLLPLLSSDNILIFSVVGYAWLVSLLSVLSYLLMDRVPGYPPDILWILEESGFAYVGTCSREGEPHVTPVIFVFDGKSAYFVTSKVSMKIANLRENPAIAFLVDVRDPINIMNNRAVMILGKAKILTPIDFVVHLPTVLHLRVMFYKKYPAYMKKYQTEREILPPAWRTTMFLSRLLIRVNIEKTVYWRQARPVTIQT